MTKNAAELALEEASRALSERRFADAIPLAEAALVGPLDRNVPPSERGERYDLPERSLAHHILGTAHLELGDRKRAIAAWRAVVALVPKSVWARHELSDILVRDDRGEMKTKRDKEGDEGRALLQATALEGSDSGAGNLLESLDAVAGWADIIRFA